MKISYKFNPNTITYVLLFFPFFKPVGLVSFSIIGNIFQIWKLISLGIIAVLLCSDLHNLSFGIKLKGILGFCIFGFIYIINCICLRTPVNDIFNNVITNILLMVFIWRILKKNKRIIKSFLQAINWIFSTWIILQIISVFLVRLEIVTFIPMLDDYYYLFGTDNYSAFAMIPMITISMYIDIVTRPDSKVSYRNLIVLLILCTEYIYMRSISASVACLVLGILGLLKSNTVLIWKLCNIKILLATSAILLFLILHFDIQQLFVNFIANQLGKGNNAFTLNSRTIIWQNAINLIRKKPVLGWGELSQEDINNYILYGVGHAHNILLDLLLRTGIIGLISYLYFLLVPIIHDRKNIANSYAAILLIGITAYTILSMLDAYPLMQYQYILISFLYGYKEINKKFKK